MEVLLGLIAVAIPIIILLLLLEINRRTGRTEQIIHDLQDEMRALRKELAQKTLQAPALPVTPPPAVVKEAPVPLVIAPPVVKEAPPAVTLPPAPVKKQAEDTGGINKPNLAYPIDKPPAATPPAQPRENQQPPKYQEPQPSWFERWLKDNPDMEKFIGENLANKIGIAILVLGIGFFVKYAIDQDWIKDIGRICIGLFCGTLLIGLAHRLRKNYHSFSSVLVGGGLAVFYFTIALAFNDYHRLTQTSAFVIMVVITGFAVVLSILYNRIELAIIATIGGFITPFLVSTGQGNYVVLFTYLAVLNAGLIALAYYKRWRALNFIAFVFTQVIYIGWITAKAGTTGFSYTGTFIFGSIFYAMFLLMNIIHHVSRSSKLKAFDFIILLSVNLGYYAAGMYLMGQSSLTTYKGIFTAVLGVINLTLAWVFFKQNKADKNFIYLLIGITVTYISLAAPVQLSGNYITLFWAAEMVVLFWLYQRSFIKLFKVASLLVTALMLISLMMDWGNAYSASSPIPVIFNQGFVTGICSAVAMMIIYTLMQREADTYYYPGITNNAVRHVYFYAGILLLFIFGASEIKYQLDGFDHLHSTLLMPVYIQLYVAAFTLLLFMILDSIGKPLPTPLRLIIPALVVAICFLSAPFIYQGELLMLTSGRYKIHFLTQLLSVAVLLALVYNNISYARRNIAGRAGDAAAFTWLATIAIIIIFSITAHNLFVWFYYINEASIEYAENVYSKAGLSVVWGITSFILIWLGLAKKYKPLRIIALVMFGVTLVKLFAYDIKNIPPAGKIIAFILLGVVLLLVSFMYQRLKKLIIDDKGAEK